MIDFHSHTTASDGQHTPEELVAMAVAAGVTTLAVTDHDTVGAVARARVAARAHSLTIVPGIELSAVLNGREVHVLGHYVDIDEPSLASFSESLKVERRTRMEQMIAKLKAMGVPVTMGEVEALSGGDNLGRPHLARALMDRGWVGSVKEAFDRFLGAGRPANVEREPLETLTAIQMIHRAGGTATLAHPGVSKVEGHELTQLRREGLDGLEVFHSDHVPSQREKYLRLGTELGLIPTAGSDFHGELVAPNRKLGTAAMPEASLEALEKARRQVR
jgi:hypothetical protein